MGIGIMTVVIIRNLLAQVLISVGIKPIVKILDFTGLRKVVRMNFLVVRVICPHAMKVIVCRMEESGITGPAQRRQALTHRA
ncbi:MAG: hypothetical protein DRH04_01690 [Deltaproteobacteria bacterium]|nr:MAG: hypothetical protein DRH04_01690 [Deltaproteobacteria bacterium]